MRMKQKEAASEDDEDTLYQYSTSWHK